MSFNMHVVLSSSAAVILIPSLTNIINFHLLFYGPEIFLLQQIIVGVFDL